MRRILLVVLFALTVFALRAQRFEGGVLGGFNAAQVSGDNTNGYRKPGILLGGYVMRDFSRDLFFGMEIKYSQKGSRKNPSNKTTNVQQEDLEKYIMRLGYAEVPFSLGYRTSDHISILAGLSAGYLVHSKELDNYGEIPEVEQRKFNAFDFQAFVGMRYDLTDRLALDLRLAYSVLPIRDLPGQAVFYWLDDQYSNVISTGLYCRLGR
ncbi:porin family protein [uncultured Sunxiuqinia sp.]|uniref:porin family protein n=1 Tax=uncultured Sunxiuqinia sp. TaxID=1573825 RepID=UPI002AA9243F|nr:porin family protein [uncultured Sunxiuqinia sp.]